MAQLPQIILVPVDGSSGSDAAARYAAALAQALGIPLRLLFAFPSDALDMLGVPPETMTADQTDAYSPERFATLRDERAERIFGRARKAIGNVSIPVEDALLTGDPAPAILAAAKDAEDPLIVMGSRGLSGFSELLLGSVSHRVLNHAKCPVTIVHQ